MAGGCQLVCELASRTTSWGCHARLTFMGKQSKAREGLSLNHQIRIVAGRAVHVQAGAPSPFQPDLRIEDFPPPATATLAAATSKTVSVIARSTATSLREPGRSARRWAIVDPTWPQASYNIVRNMRDKVWKTLRGPGPVAEVVKGYRDPADAGKVTQWPNAPHPEDFADPQGKMENLLDQVVDAAFTRQCEAGEAGALAAEGRQGQ